MENIIGAVNIIITTITTIIILKTDITDHIIENIHIVMKI
jgi:hypothetical protein